MLPDRPAYFSKVVACTGPFDGTSAGRRRFPAMGSSYELHATPSSSRGSGMRLIGSTLRRVTWNLTVSPTSRPEPPIWSGWTLRGPRWPGRWDQAAEPIDRHLPPVLGGCGTRPSIPRAGRCLRLQPPQHLQLPTLAATSQVKALHGQGGCCSRNYRSTSAARSGRRRRMCGRSRGREGPEPMPTAARPDTLLPRRVCMP
jgi:hypothetical protein